LQRALRRLLVLPEIAFRNGLFDFFQLFLLVFYFKESSEDGRLFLLPLQTAVPDLLALTPP